MQDEKGNTFLHKEFLNPLIDLERIKTLIKNKNDLNSINMEGKTPFFNACNNIKNIEIISYLFEFKPIVQYEFENKEICIFEQIYETQPKNIELIKLFINKAEFESYPFEKICRDKELNREIIEIFLEKNKNEDITEELTNICSNEAINEEILSLFMRELNYDYDDNNVLFEICKNKSLTIKMLQMLKEKGFNKDSKDSNDTSLHSLCSNNNLNSKILNFFLNNFDCDINFKNSLHQIPLIVLIKNINCNPKLIKIMIDNKSIVDKYFDNKGNNIFHYLFNKTNTNINNINNINTNTDNNSNSGNNSNINNNNNNTYNNKININNTLNNNNNNNINNNNYNSNNIYINNIILIILIIIQIIQMKIIILIIAMSLSIISIIILIPTIFLRI